MEIIIPFNVMWLRGSGFSFFILVHPDFKVSVWKCTAVILGLIGWVKLWFFFFSFTFKSVKYFIALREMQYDNDTFLCSLFPKFLRNDENMLRNGSDTAFGPVFHSVG